MADFRSSAKSMSPVSGCTRYGNDSKVDWCGTDLLPGSVISMGQMTSTWQIQPHDSGMRRQKGCINRKVCWTARVGLHIHTPIFFIKVESFQCTILTEIFHLVNDFISSIVPVSWLSLRILVGQRRAQAFHDSPRGEVLRGNEFDAPGRSTHRRFDQTKNVQNLKVPHEKSYKLDCKTAEVSKNQFLPPTWSVVPFPVAPAHTSPGRLQTMGGCRTKLDVNPWCQWWCPVPKP